MIRRPRKSAETQRVGLYTMRRVEPVVNQGADAVGSTRGLESWGQASSSCALSGLDILMAVVHF
jgi:hypothetical protein